MAQLMICAEFLRLRNKTSGAFETGLTVQLLPDGGTAPGDLITLTENAGLGGQYDFGGSVTNGKYDVYVGGSAVMLNGEQVSIYVLRDGIVTATDTDFAEDAGAWSP